MWLLRKTQALLGTSARALVALVGITGITVAVADYAATVGSGTNFGSVIQTSVHYTKNIVCDFVAPATICATVKAANTVASTDVGLVVAVANTLTPGQKNMAGSSPVVIASDQSSVPVTVGALPAGTNTIGTVGQLPYPVGAVPITASATGTTAATTATLAAAVAKTTYICGFSIRANATAAVTSNATVSGTITGTLNFTQWTAPNASGLGVTEMIFSPCVPASATNTTISATSAAPGTGGIVSTTSWGYQL